MKKSAKLITTFKGSGPISPNSQRKQHERAGGLLVAFRTNQVPHYAKRGGAAPVVGWTSREAPREEEEGGGAHQPQ
jgi:hypothetical protein